MVKAAVRKEVWGRVDKSIVSGLDWAKDLIRGMTLKIKSGLDEGQARRIGLPNNEWKKFLKANA